MAAGEREQRDEEADANGALEGEDDEHPFQADVAAFGEALIAWPDVWEMGRQHVASHTNARPL